MKKTYYPIIVERDEDNFFVAECPMYEGCYTQGKSYDEAMKNIKAVIRLCEKQQASGVRKNEVSLTMVTL